jgi:hypothetical protein
MLLVRLNAVHNALDAVELGQANPDPEMVKLIEAVRNMGIGGDAQEGQPLSADAPRDTEDSKP